MAYQRTTGYKSKDYNLRSRCDQCRFSKTVDIRISNIKQTDNSKLQEEIDVLRINTQADNSKLQEEIDVLRINTQADNSKLQEEIDVLRIKTQADNSKLQEEIDVLNKTVEFLQKEIDDLKKTKFNPCLEDVCERVDLLYTILSPDVFTGITLRQPIT